MSSIFQAQTAMAPRFVEINTPLEAAAQSDAAAFLFSLNANRWVDDLQTAFNLTDKTKWDLDRMTAALHRTATVYSAGHLMLAVALMMAVLREVLLRVSVRRALQRKEHED